MYGDVVECTSWLKSLKLKNSYGEQEWENTGKAAKKKGAKSVLAFQSTRGVGGLVLNECIKPTL